MLACIYMRFVELTGKFGRWEVIKLVPNTRPFRWVCRCECGAISEVIGTHLKSGASQSCGCLHRERMAMFGRTNRTHGKSGNRTYRSWGAMISRCTNPTATGYDRYGGRGIRVCPEWLTFDKFLADMGERPMGLSLDRYPDPNGNYEAANCRWATPKQQANNRRRIHTKNVA